MLFLRTHVMLLLLIDVQWLLNAVFSITKRQNDQNHSFCPVPHSSKKKPSKIFSLVQSPTPRTISPFVLFSCVIVWSSHTDLIHTHTSNVWRFYTDDMGFACTMIWVKVFKNGPSKICGRQPLKKLKSHGLLRQTISLQFFLRLPSTILLGPFLNTLTHLISHLHIDTDTDTDTDTHTTQSAHKNQ